MQSLLLANTVRDGRHTQIFDDDLVSRIYLSRLCGWTLNLFLGLTGADLLVMPVTCYRSPFAIHLDPLSRLAICGFNWIDSSSVKGIRRMPGWLAGCRGRREKKVEGR